MGQGQHKALESDLQAQHMFEQLDLQPWDSRGLIRSVLKRQAERAKRSDLRKVPVKVGFDKFIGGKSQQDAARGFFAKDISKKTFVDLGVRLFREQRIPGSRFDLEQDLREVYDTIDFDHSGGLDVSEIAAGLCTFLGHHESMEEHVKAVFETIDVDHHGTLELSELQFFLRPFVKGMTPRDFPAEGEPLREYFVVRASWQIWKELVQVAARRVEKDVLDTCRTADEVLKTTHVKDPLDWLDKDGKFEAVGGVTADDLVKWVQGSNSILGSLGKVIDRETYMFWLSSSRREAQWHEHKRERDAKEERLLALELELRLQPPQGPPPQPARPSLVRQQQQAAAGGGWLASWWPRLEGPSQAPVPAASWPALGPPSPHRFSQAHHWNVPLPPPPPRGRPSRPSPGQASAQPPVLLGHSFCTQQSRGKARQGTPPPEGGRGRARGSTQEATHYRCPNA